MQLDATTHQAVSLVDFTVQGVLVELPLAGFFLKKMRNPHSDVNDLVTLDPELYRNLMFMRDYHGDFADLTLTFTTADSDITHTREVGTPPAPPPPPPPPPPSPPPAPPPPPPRLLPPPLAVSLLNSKQLHIDHNCSLVHYWVTFSILQFALAMVRCPTTLPEAQPDEMLFLPPLPPPTHPRLSQT